MRTPVIPRTVRWAAIVGLVATLLVLPLSQDPVTVTKISMVFVWAVAACGLNVATGYNGQISLGHSAFFGLGAYCSAILISKVGIDPWLTVPLTAITCFVVGVGFGLPAARLKGIYLAVVTITLAIVFVPFVKRFKGLTGGVQGMVVEQPGAPDALGLAPDQWRYYVVLAVAVVGFWLTYNLVHSRVGRAIVAIRDNDLAATSIGVDASRLKVFAFAWSGALAGVAGALYAALVGFVSPESFGLFLSIKLLAAVIIGGAGFFWGPVYGAIFVEFVPSLTSEIHQALSGVVYGTILILVILLAPAGISGVVRTIRDRVLRLLGVHGRESPIEKPSRADTSQVSVPTMSGAAERGEPEGT